MTEIQERRAEGAGRVRVETLVEVCGNEPGIPAFEAEAVDVSARGMHLRTAYLPDNGAPLVCRFEEGGREIVVEGRVAILVKQSRQSDRPVDPEATTLLSAGDQVIVTAREAVRPPRGDVPAITAWTQRQIVFHATTLSEVCEQFNRYNRKQLIIEDPELQSVRVSGVFSTTDPTSLLRFLQERIQLVMTEKDGRIVISRK